MSFSIPDRWAALAAQVPERTVGRITLQEKGMYRTRTVMGEQNALVSGKHQFNQKLKNGNAFAAGSESYLAAKEKKFREISKINKNNKKR